MPLDPVQANAKFLADVIAAAQTAEMTKPDAALQMKTVRGGGVSFKSMTAKTAGNVFHRSANVAIRQQLFNALSSIEGTEGNAVLLNELREKLGLPLVDGGKVSNKPLSARSVLDIVKTSLAKASETRLKNELNGIWSETVEMPGFHSEPEGTFHGGAIRRLSNFACRLVGLKASDERVQTVMDAAMEYISGSNSPAGVADRFEQFTAIARKAADLVGWEKDARRDLGVLVLTSTKGLAGEISLGATNALKLFVDAKVDNEMKEVLAQFAKRGVFSLQNAYQKLAGEIKPLLPIFTEIRKGVSVGEVVKEVAKKALLEKMPSLKRNLNLLAQNHPEIADLVRGQFDAMKASCLKGILSQVAPGVTENWKTTDLEKVTAEVQTRAARMAERLTAAIDKLEKTLTEAEEALLKNPLDGDIRRATPDGGTLSKAQMLKLVRNDESYRYYVSRMLERLQNPTHLDAGRSDKKMVGDAASNAQAAFNRANSTFEAFLTGKQLAGQIAEKVQYRLGLMNDDFEDAVLENPVCKTAFELPEEASVELKALAKDVRDFCKTKIAEEFKGLLNAPGRMDLGNWPTPSVTARVVAKVKAKINEAGGFAAHYAQDLRKICNAKILNTVMQLQGVSDAFKAALVPAFEKVGQDALPDAFRFEAKDIETVETDRYKNLNAQAAAVLTKSTTGEAEVELAEIPKVPDIKADVGEAVARAEKAVKILAEVTKEIGSYVSDRKLTWLVSPRTLKLDLDNFDSHQSDSRLTEALTTVKKEVLAAVNGGTEPDVWGLTSGVKNTIQELASAAHDRLRSEGFVAQLTTKAINELPGDIRSALTTELTDEIRNEVSRMMGSSEGGPVKALKKVRDWFQKGLKKINLLATEATKSLPPDQMALVLRDSSFVALKAKLLVTEILVNSRDGIPVDPVTYEYISVETYITRTLTNKMSQIAKLQNETSRKQVEDLETLISGLNDQQLGEFGVKKTTGGNWLDGLSLENVKELVGVLAQNELKARKLSGKVDLRDILQTAVMTLFDPAMRSDMKVIVDYVRQSEKASVGGRIRGLFGKITGSRTEITDEDVKSVVMNELRKCCENPKNYRRSYFDYTMTEGWTLNKAYLDDELKNERATNHK